MVAREDANRNCSFLAAPSGLLIAAVVAAIPLGGECIGIYQCESVMHPGKMDNKAYQKKITNSIHSCIAAGGLTGGKPQAQIFIMGLDALGGYVFARMAHNEGILPFPSSLNI
jgi:hypothetical protein